MDNDPIRLSLNGRLKFLLRDSVVYGGAGAVSKLFSLFTFPIMARYFSIEDYGIIDAFTVLSSLLVTLLVFGQDSAVARFFYEYEADKDRRQVVSQSLALQFFILVIGTPVLIVLADPVSRYYSNKDDLEWLTKLVIYQVPFGLVINFAGNILKWTFKRFQFLFLQLGSVFTYVMAVIAAILFFDVGVKEVFQIFLVSRVVFALIGIAFIYKWITFKINANHLKELIRYGTPYGLICIVGALIPALDRFFINKYLTAYELGLYAVAYKVAFLIQLPINAFQTAWGPFFLSIFKAKDAPETYNSVFLSFTVLVTIIGLALILFTGIIIDVLAGSKYAPAGIVVMPIVSGMVIMSIGWIISIGIDLSKKSEFKLVSALLRLVITAIVILLLIKPLGLVGVAVGFLAGQLFNTIVETLISYSVYPLRFKLGPPMVTFVLFSLFGLLPMIVFSESRLVQAVVNSLILVLFVLILWIIPLKRRNLFRLLTAMK